MSIGLDDVVAAETALSHVDGAAGRLILKGHDVEDLAGRRRFEAVAALLWDGLLEPALDEAALAAALGEGRARAFALAAPLLASAARLPPTEGLRLLLAGLSDTETLPHAVLATAAVPVFVAAQARAWAGRPPIAPDPAAGHAADFLRMLRGRAAAPREADALDAYLVTVMDHGLNASTFTARVIASTRAGLLSSVCGALCALKGPLHGGAPGPVLDMLDAIGSPENAEPWIRAALARGDRLMGFGHRVYRVRDPRAEILKGAAARLGVDAGRIRFAEAVERAALAILAEAKPGRRLETNVEFYTALVLEALGIPREAFTPVFAIGRVAGWAGHVMEQEKGGRLVRPQSAYVGPLPRAA